MALVSLPYAPMVPMKINALVAVRSRLNAWDVDVKNDDGSPFDLTIPTAITSLGMAVYSAREVEGDHVHYVDPVLKLSDGAGISVVVAEVGELTLEVTGAMLEARDPGLYWWDLWAVDAVSGERLVLVDKAEFRIQE